MKNKSLIQIAQSLIELDPEAPENSAFIDKAIGELGEKVNSYHFIKTYAESQIEMLKKEKAHLDGQIKLHNNLIDRLSDRAKYVLETLGQKELKSETGHKLQLRESERVEIDDITMLPDKYVKQEISFTADKIKIKDAIKSGEEVNGAKITKHTSVVFK